MFENIVSFVFEVLSCGYHRLNSKNLDEFKEKQQTFFNLQTTKNPENITVGMKYRFCLYDRYFVIMILYFEY